MAKGAIAKQAVIDKISAALGQDWIGEFDKKYYVWADENGERIQVSIALTCPKTPIVLDEAPNLMHGGRSFDDTPVTQEIPPAVITKEEEDSVEQMLKRLGL